MITVARASRNQILRQYRVMREKHRQNAVTVRKKVKKAVHTNAVALAVRENPSLTKTDGKKKRLDPDLLATYMKEHGPRLRMLAQDRLLSSTVLCTTMSNTHTHQCGALSGAAGESKKA